MIRIILPVYNRIGMTRRIVGDLCRQTFTQWQLLLIDDGSLDGTVEAVAELLPREKFTAIRGDGSLWWGGALHKAWQALRTCRAEPGDAVLILNDDVRIAPDFLAAGINCLAGEGNVWLQAIALGGEGTAPLGGIRADLRRLRFVAAFPGEPINCLSTRGLLLDLVSFQRSGGFHPRLLPHYLSDYEFTIRAAGRGIRLVVCDSFVVRMDSQSTGIRIPPEGGLRRFLTTALSNRYAENPLHLSAFVLLRCPFWSIPRNLLRVWSGFLRKAAAAAFVRSRATGEPP